MAHKQQIIIFEGPDGCGKTNISAELSRRTGIPVFKNDGEWSNFGSESAAEYFRLTAQYSYPFALSLIRQTRLSVIFDRAHPSEWAYSRAFGRSRCDDLIARGDELCAALGAKIIIPLRSDYSGVVDEYGVTPTHLQALDGLYREYAERVTKCETLILNVDDENLDRELEEITKFLEAPK